MMLTMTTPPACEPITLDEVKLWNRIDTTADDYLLARAIPAARRRVEIKTHRQLVCAGYLYCEDDFPWFTWYTGRRADEYAFPRPPLIQVDQIAYYPPYQNVAQSNYANQTLTVLDPSFYNVDKGSIPGRYHLAFSKYWPAVCPEINAVQHRYHAGHLTPFTVNTTTSVITLLGRNIAPLDPFGQAITMTFTVIGTTGALPSPLAASTVYYPVSISGATCQLSLTSGGSPITLTTTGTANQCFINESPDPDDIEIARQAIAMLIGGSYTHGREAQTDIVLHENVAFDSLIRSLVIGDMEV